MIELLPHHKVGLQLASPVMIAAGFAGYGDAIRHVLDLAAFGAVVTQPITLRPQRGAPQPRPAEIEGGVIINTGQQNPGVKKVLTTYGRLWARLNTQIIAHLPAADPADLQRTAHALSTNAALAGLELGLPASAYPADVFDWVAAVRNGSELPLLAQLPFGAIPEVVDAAVEAGADGMVVSAPPLATAKSGSGQFVSGGLYGFAAHSLVLQQVQSIAANFDVPLVAAGGIHSVADARTFIEAGATAVQVDALLLRSFQQAEEIAHALALQDESFAR